MNIQTVDTYIRDYGNTYVIVHKSCDICSDTDNYHVSFPDISIIICICGILRISNLNSQKI